MGLKWAIEWSFCRMEAGKQKVNMLNTTNCRMHNCTSAHPFIWPTYVTRCSAAIAISSISRSFFYNPTEEVVIIGEAIGVQRKHAPFSVSYILAWERGANEKRISLSINSQSSFCSNKNCNFPLWNIFKI